MTLDTRFLTVHPRTALWWMQREQCHRCANMQQRPEKHYGNRNTSGSGGGTNCVLGTGKEVSCISMREENARCGPFALLFKPL